MERARSRFQSADGVVCLLLAATDISTVKMSVEYQGKSDQEIISAMEADLNAKSDPSNKEKFNSASSRKLSRIVAQC